MSEDLNQLLRRASDLPGGPVLSPVPEIVRRAQTRRRRQWVVTAACAAAAVAVAVVVPTALSRNPGDTAPVNPSPAPPPAGTTTAAALAHGHWGRLAHSPVLDRTGYTAAWTGRQVLVWGGSASSGDGVFSDGGSYDPATDSWQPIPRAPLAGRYGAAAAWTGSELFVWGGGAYRDGALYNPVTRTWRMLPPAPLGARSDAQALWTGSRVVVLGGTTQDSSDRQRQVAAYDPVADTWTALPPLPEWYEMSAVAAGGSVYAWVGSGAVQILRYDQGATSWVAMPFPDGDGKAGVGDAVWTGHELVIPAAGPFCPRIPGCSLLPRTHLTGRALDTSTGIWRVIPHGPVDGTEGPAVWAGGALLLLGTAYDPGFGAGPPFGAVLDLATLRWYRIPDAPTRSDPAATIWAGDQLIVLGTTSNTPGHPSVGVGLRFHP
jgi:hypothetical protein